MAYQNETAAPGSITSPLRSECLHISNFLFCFTGIKAPVRNWQVTFACLLHPMANNCHGKCKKRQNKQKNKNQKHLFCWLIYYCGNLSFNFTPLIPPPLHLHPGTPSGKAARQLNWHSAYLTVVLNVNRQPTSIVLRVPQALHRSTPLTILFSSAPPIHPVHSVPCSLSLSGHLWEETLNCSSAKNGPCCGRVKKKSKRV